MIFLDTNIFLRYFEREDELTYRKVEKLFFEIVHGNIKGISNTMVIAEVIWVLDKFYNWEKEKICENVELILNTPNIKFKERSIVLEAIDIFKGENVDFIDAYNCAYMRASGVGEIYSFDRHFDEFTGIKRLEP